MANLNKVLLIGNLTRDPELRYTPGGTAVASFGLATNRKFRTSSGEDREDTCFVDINAFGRQAEVLSEYMAKGRQIFIEGRLHLDQWEDKQTGAKRSKLTVTVENFQFLGGRGEQGGARRSSPGRAESQAQAQPAADDDIPF
ncbi:MAG: single-stranded DNA-binding protein [Planctomycetota bacterium]|jgi:single-strand DNA-binding protein